MFLFYMEKKCWHKNASNVVNILVPTVVVVVYHAEHCIPSDTAASTTWMDAFPSGGDRDLQRPEERPNQQHFSRQHIRPPSAHLSCLSLLSSTSFTAVSFLVILCSHLY